MTRRFVEDPIQASIVQYLRTVVCYNPASGDFIYQVAGPRRKVGFPAGYVGIKGYRYIRVDGVCYFAHRLVWLLHTGKWPSDQIDHANGDRLDNRFENLREANNSENMGNRKLNKNSSLGIKGVSYRRGYWIARIQKDNRRVELGYFKSADEARQAYACAAKEKFGIFARVL